MGDYCEGAFSPQCAKVRFWCDVSCGRFKDLAGPVLGELGGCFERLKRLFGETAFIFGCGAWCLCGMGSASDASALIFRGRRNT